jgi:hypothetical protein
MKKEILKIAGVKSEKEFYKKYPTEEAFMKAHKKEFKKAAMGAAMVKKQLNQLTDFANPPQAEVGDYIGGDQSAAFKPMNYTDIYDQADYATTGMNRQMRMQDAALAAQQTIAANSGKKGGGILGMLGQLAPQLDALSSDSTDISTPGAGQFAEADADMNANFAADISAGMRYGGYVPKAQGGFIQGLTNFSNKTGKSIGQGYDKLDKGLGKVGGVTGAIPIVGDIVQGFQQIKQERDLKRQSRQNFDLSGLTKQVAGLAPDIKQRKYVRPEDQAFGTQQMGQAYGVAPNNPFVAAYGARVGGNPTEIQNIYNPGDIYSDMGYEPLEDSEIVKQYKRGGHIPKAQFGDIGNAFGSWIGGGHGKPTGGGKVGGAVGKTLGMITGVPGASQVGELLGSTVGSIFGGKSAKQTERYQTGAQNNLQNAAFMQGVRGIQGQNSAYMEDGGWVSHDWQPQVITQFGEYDMKDLLKPPHDADMLRAGGHLRAYTAPSEAAMSTERPEMAMGGQLKTTWGGYADPISHNPYLPGSGETVMFRGKSHEESDGNGHTGIGVKYGGGGHDDYTNYAEYGTEQADADVEVERGEPATELPDAETGDVSMVVYGNMKIPSYGVSELGDPKAKGQKFKTYAKDLSKQEAKHNKTVEKGLKIIDSIDGDNPFDLLKLNSGKAMVMGGNEALKGLAIQKQRLAGIQNAILDTAEEMGVESDALAKGQIKPIKDSNMAKFGAKLETAQKGKKKAKSEPQLLPMNLGKPSSAQLALEDLLFRKENPEPVGINLTDKFLENESRMYDPFGKSKTDLPSPSEFAAMDQKWKNKLAEKEKNKADLMNIYRQLQPYLIPSNQQPFDYGQIIPEMYALGNNQLEPVQAQTFQPLLEQPYSVSLQDQLNANQADFNALQRQIGYNPAALSQLSAQKYAANSNILGQQFRANQEMQMGAYNRNRGVLNDATLKNLAILDTQYQRQAQAKSATKAQAQAALSSIADKIAKHKLENRTLGVYENMYNYRFGPKGRAINANVAGFDTSVGGGSTDTGEKGRLAPGYEYTYDANQNIIGTRKSPKTKSGGDDDEARNGTIVKGMKNL